MYLKLEYKYIQAIGMSINVASDCGDILFHSPLSRLSEKFSPNNNDG